MTHEKHDNSSGEDSGERTKRLIRAGIEREEAAAAKAEAEGKDKHADKKKKGIFRNFFLYFRTFNRF